MGVDVRLSVEIGNKNVKNVFKILEITEKAIASLFEEAGEDFSPRYKIFASLKMMRLIFSYKQEQRLLMISFIQENEIIFNLGRWGEAEAIMQTIGLQFANEGYRVYYNSNDSLEDNWVVIEKEAIA